MKPLARVLHPAWELGSSMSETCLHPSRELLPYMKFCLNAAAVDCRSVAMCAISASAAITAKSPSDTCEHTSRYASSRDRVFPDVQSKRPRLLSQHPSAPPNCPPNPSVAEPSRSWPGKRTTQPMNSARGQLSGMHVSEWSA